MSTTRTASAPTAPARARDTPPRLRRTGRSGRTRRARLLAVLGAAAASLCG
jgi:hypothetical protein